MELPLLETIAAEIEFPENNKMKNEQDFSAEHAVHIANTKYHQEAEIYVFLSKPFKIPPGKNNLLLKF